MGVGRSRKGNAMMNTFGELVTPALAAKHGRTVLIVVCCREKQQRRRAIVEPRGKTFVRMTCDIFPIEESER